MATKLKKMKLTSVDLVRAGANQEADICLFKSAEEREKDVEAAQDQHREEVSGYHDALMASVRSIQEDKDLDEETRQDLLQETWEQYCNAMAEVLGFEFEGEDLEPEPEAEPEEPDFDEIEEVEKFNHNHGPDGKFAPSGGGGGGGLNAKVKGLMSQQYGGYDVPKLVDQMKVGDRVKVHNHKKNEDYEFEKLSDKNTISAFQNVNGKNHMASPDHVKGWVLDDVLNGGTPTFVEKGLDTIVEVEKFNPFHDALGRFANKNGFKTYSANPKSTAGAAAINRSAVAGHTSTMNVHRESKGENIGQNYQWLLTGQKPAHLTGGGSGGASAPQKPKQQKPKQKKPAQTQPQGQAQKPAATTSSHTPVKGKDLTGSFAYDPKSKDSAVQQAAQAQGFTGKGKVVSQAEFDAAVQASGVIAFRTVNDGQDVKTGKRVKAAAFADNILHGDAGKFSLNGSGGQAYGGGMYMAGTSKPKKGTSPSSNAVTNAVRDSHGYGNAGNAATISVTLDPGAKIGNYNTVRAAFSKLPRSERVKYDYDVGAYAAAKGYDALRSTNAGWGCDYYMVYNRTKLIFLDQVDPY